MGKQNQILLKPTEVELGLQVGVEFDKIDAPRVCEKWVNCLILYRAWKGWFKEKGLKKIGQTALIWHASYRRKPPLIFS